MRVLVVQHEPTAPPGQLGDALAAAGVEADVRLAADGDGVPAELDGADGLAVLGGAMGAKDDDRFPHLLRARALIREAAEHDVPALCICLGAQLAALELGGDVARRPHGYRIGWRPVRLPARDPVVAAVGDDDRLFFWHQDYFRAPPGADELLVPGDGFRRGSIVAIQAHPEADEAMLRTWCDMDNGAAELAEAGVTREQVLGPASEYAGGGRRLLDAWCAEITRARAGRAA